MPNSSELTIQEHANEIRKLIILMLTKAGSGHSAGALGLADIFATLYFKVAKHDPHNPNWEGRDRIILSNGHTCPVLYATLAETGYFSKDELDSLRVFGSFLEGHPRYGSVPGVENTSGPLGQGLSQACGLAEALRLDKKTNRVFCITSDGEHQEGQTWEAYMYAAHHKLSNLTVLIDRNNIQIDGFTEDIMSLEPLKQKIESFGWAAQTINGHNIEEIKDALQNAENTHRPVAIICHTTPGKGVDFMENKPEWHGKPPTAAQAQEALAELRKLAGDYAHE